MVADRSLELVFNATVASPAGTYGAATRTYGEVGWSYGQALAEGTETSYQLTAYPGWGPRSPDWEYRQWDTTPAMNISLIGPSGATIVYSTIASATLVLTQTSYGGYDFYSPVYTLTVAADRLTRTWVQYDLPAVGMYRAVVKLVFTSGRTMTIPSNDDAGFIVREGKRP